VTNLKCLTVALVLQISVFGCATLPEDRGMGDVRSLVADRSGQTASLATPQKAELVTQLLSQPLTAQRAAQIALLNNPQLRAEYAHLGIAAAAVYDAGRLSNPRLGASVMYSSESSAANQVTFGLAQSFTDLLLLPSRSRLAEGEFARTKQEVGAAVINLVTDVESAYYTLIGAQQVAALRSVIATAAQASAKLAQRFFDAGNVNALELALEQSAASQAHIDSMRAATEADAARNALNRLLGLRAADGRWTTPDQLQLPVAQEDSLEHLLLLAQQSRLDLAATKTQLELLANELGVTHTFRYVGEIEIGVETERETDRSRLTGPALSIELPIFNSGEGKIARAEALLDDAEARWQWLVLEVGNEVQLAYNRVQSSRAVSEYFRDALLPQRAAVVQYTQQEFNYMLAGQFELLLAKQQEYEAYEGYLIALRDYWVARTELSRAVGAQLPSTASVSSDTAAPIRLPNSTPSGMHHMNHGANSDAHKGDHQ
jgi:outer membrane protein TolC